MLKKCMIIMLKLVLILAGFWFYIVWQEPSIMNQILFVIFLFSLGLSALIDVIQAMGRYVNPVQYKK